MGSVVQLQEDIRPEKIRSDPDNRPDPPSGSPCPLIQSRTEPDEDFRSDELRDRFVHVVVSIRRVRIAGISPERPSLPSSPDVETLRIG